MKTNKKTYLLRLETKEFDKLKKRASASGLTVSTFIRRRINGETTQSIPDNSFSEIVWSISKIQNDVNKIMQQALASGTVSKEQTDTVAFLVEKCLERLNEMG